VVIKNSESLNLRERVDKNEGKKLHEDEKKSDLLPLK
jgi:hypothetical protein